MSGVLIMLLAAAAHFDRTSSAVVLALVGFAEAMYGLRLWRRNRRESPDKYARVFE